MRGLGHLYRALSLVKELELHGKKCLIYCNNHNKSLMLIKEKGVQYYIVEDLNASNDWQSKLIARDGISMWIDDRLDTHLGHSINVKIFVNTCDNNNYCIFFLKTVSHNVR